MPRRMSFGRRSIHMRKRKNLHRQHGRHNGRATRYISVVTNAYVHTWRSHAITCHPYHKWTHIYYLTHTHTRAYYMQPALCTVFFLLISSSKWSHTNERTQKNEWSQAECYILSICYSLSISMYLFYYKHRTHSKCLPTQDMD